MSLYEKESYSQSKVVFLAGPIEWWWGERFHSLEAVHYRAHREYVSQCLVEAGYLVYRPWDAFKGSWNERMQDVNDFVLLKSDIVIDMTPPGVEAIGTAHEVGTALRNIIPVRGFPPMPNDDVFQAQMGYLLKELPDIIDRWEFRRAHMHPLTTY